MHGPPLSAHRSPLRRIHGIEDFWARKTLRAVPSPSSRMADQILLDVLGLGIEQALTYLPRERPDFDAFEAWVLATAGPPEPDRVARFNAWVTGAPMPDATSTQLAAIDARPPALDAADLAHWDRHGFVVLRGAVTRDEAAAAEALLWRLVGGDPGDPASWYGPRTNGIMIQHFQDPVLEAARRSPRIHKAFAQLLGTADLWSSTDRVSFNPPETTSHPFQGPNLHWDTSLAEPIPLTTGGILYLTDTAANQGALRVVPGFHRRIPDWLAGLCGAVPEDDRSQPRGSRRPGRGRGPRHLAAGTAARGEPQHRGPVPHGTIRQPLLPLHGRAGSLVVGGRWPGRRPHDRDPPCPTCRPSPSSPPRPWRCL